MRDVADQLAARERGVTLSLAASAELHASVRADIGLIERVLQNLVDNALTHTPRGGAVTLAVERDGPGALRVAVIDSGSGIAREHLPHIFERYWRADDAPASPGHGASAGFSAIACIASSASSRDVFASSSPSQMTTRLLNLSPQTGCPKS